MTQRDAQERGQFLKPGYRLLVEKVAEGKTAGRIAEELGKSRRTVEGDIKKASECIRWPGPLRHTPSADGHRLADVLTSFYACLTQGSTVAPAPWDYLGPQGRDTPALPSTGWRSSGE